MEPMSLADIYLSARAVLAKIQAREFVAAGRELVKIADTFLDIAASAGFKCTAEDEQAKAKIETVLKECHAEIDACCAAGPVKGEAVGKLGDGVLLKILLDAALKFLPLFI